MASLNDNGDTAMNPIGPALRSRREEAGLSQPALAARTGINQSTISRIERGLRAPTLRQITALARAFGVPVSALLDEAA